MVWCLAIVLLLIPAGVLAAQRGKKGSSDKAYEKSSEKAKFKRGEEGKVWKDEKKQKKGKKKKHGGPGDGDELILPDDEEGSPAGHKQKEGQGKRKKRN